MGTKTITLRLPIDVAQYIENQNAGSFTDNVKEVCSKLKALETHTDKEVTDIFTPDEWEFLYDSMSGVMIEDWMRYRPDLLVYHNEDAERYDGTASWWDVDLVALNEKCKGLTSAQVDAVYRKVEQFWKRSSED